MIRVHVNYQYPLGVRSVSRIKYIPHAMEKDSFAASPWSRRNRLHHCHCRRHHNLRHLGDSTELFRTAFQPFFSQFSFDSEFSVPADHKNNADELEGDQVEIFVHNICISLLNDPPLRDTHIQQWSMSSRLHHTSLKDAASCGAFAHDKLKQIRIPRS